MKAFFNLWILLTLAVFHFGPVPWPGQGSTLVTVVVLASLAGFNAGSSLGGRMAPLGDDAGHSMRTMSMLVLVGLWIVLSAIHIWSVTGLNMFNPADYSLDFGNVYYSFQRTLRDVKQYGRDGLVEMAIALKAIVFVAILVILAGEFRRRPLLVVAIFFPLVGSSMMRGTDREMADLTILAGILFYYHGMLKRRALLLAAMVALLLIFFLERKIGRFSEFLPRCIPDTIVCFDFDSWRATHISRSAEILWVLLTNYLSQGYHGMYLALSLPFEFNWGIGHLPAVKTQLCNSLHLGCGLEDFQSRLTEAGWDTKRHWTSAYTVLANDFHWVLVPVYFAFIGLLFGVSDRSWRQNGDRISLAVILLISIFMIYSSAGMQIGISLDWSTATVGLFGLQTMRLIFHRRNARSLAPGMPA